MLDALKFVTVTVTVTATATATAVSIILALRVSTVGQLNLLVNDCFLASCVYIEYTFRNDFRIIVWSIIWSGEKYPSKSPR